jgi:hypothetical protein
MKRTLPLSLMFAASFVGFGCSTAPPTTGGIQDLSTGGGADIAMTGGGPDGGTKPDMAKPVVTTGTKLTSGAYVLVGMTTDGQVVGEDTANKNALTAISIAGGKPQIIEATASSFSMHGKAVFVWESIDQTSGVGVGNVWQASIGGKQAFPNGAASIAGLVDISPDGGWLYYSGNALSDGTATDVYVAKGDGSSSIKFGTQVATDPTGKAMTCSSYGRFTTASNKLVFLACGAGAGDGDAGMAGNALWLVDPTTGKTTTIANNVGNWFQLDPMDKAVVAPDPTDTMYIYQLSGGPGQKVDDGVKDAAFLPDGTAVVYRTGAGALKRAASSGAPAPTTLQASNVNVIQRWFYTQTYLPCFSADSKWLVVSNSFDGQTGGDLEMVSTSSMAAPTTLVAPGKNGFIFGDPFTTDSSTAVYYSGTVNVGGNALVGTYTLLPVTGGMQTVVAQKVWVSYNGPGSLSWYNDHYTAGKMIDPYGKADLELIDVKDPTKPKLVATQAEADFYFTPDRKTIAYSILAGTAAGVYAVPSAL